MLDEPTGAWHRRTAQGLRQRVDSRRQTVTGEGYFNLI